MLSLIVIGIMFTSVYNMHGGILNQVWTALGLEGPARDWLGSPSTALGNIIFVRMWKGSGFATAMAAWNEFMVPLCFSTPPKMDHAAHGVQFLRAVLRDDGWVCQGMNHG